MSAVDTSTLTVNERLDRLSQSLGRCEERLDRLSRSLGRCEETLLDLLARAEAPKPSGTPDPQPDD